MPLIQQKMIYRSNLKDNPDFIYVFGDNLERRGYGGQASEMRGEPNAFGIPTKESPHRPLLDDKHWHVMIPQWTADFTLLHLHLDEGTVVVVPEDGIGTGLARLHETAPRLNDVLQALWQILLAREST